jgi:hypothetical protein
VKLSASLLVRLLLVIALLPRTVLAAEEQTNSGLKTIAKIGYIGGGSLLGFAALTALSANSTDAKNRYHDKCHGSESCSDRHYTRDMNESRILAGVGVLLIGGAVGLTIYRRSTDEQANLNQEYDSFLVLQPVLKATSVDKRVWGSMLNLSLKL